MKFKLTETFLTEGKNIDKTFQQYKDKLRKKFTELGYVIDSDEGERLSTKAAWFDIVLNNDPTFVKGSTTTGDYGIWLTNLFVNSDKRYCERNFYRGSDISELLKEFSTKKPNLEKKDINQYKSLEEVRQVLDATPLSKKQLQRQLQNIKNISSEDLLYQDDDWSVFSPSTYESSCALRKGASWCTGATESDYHYQNYTRNGKLYIFINNHNPRYKYQMFVPNGTSDIKEFRDKTNSSVSQWLFFRENPSLYKYLYDNQIIDYKLPTGESCREKIDALSSYLRVNPLSITVEADKNRILFRVPSTRFRDSYYLWEVLLASESTYEYDIDKIEHEFRYGDCSLFDLVHSADYQFRDDLTRYILDECVINWESVAYDELLYILQSDYDSMEEIWNLAVDMGVGAEADESWDEIADRIIADDMLYVVKEDPKQWAVKTYGGDVLSILSFGNINCRKFAEYYANKVGIRQALLDVDIIKANISDDLVGYRRVHPML